VSDHEEADSRMFVHIAHTTQANNVKRVLLWSIDTDVATMCPKYCLSCGIEEFYFKTGTGNKKRFILMHLVADRLGEDMAHVLPRLYALSGCDSTSFFSGIGKQRWMTMASAHPDLLKVSKNWEAMQQRWRLKLKVPVTHWYHFCMEVVQLNH